MSAPPMQFDGHVGRRSATSCPAVRSRLRCQSQRRSF